MLDNRKTGFSLIRYPKCGKYINVNSKFSSKRSSSREEKQESGPPTIKILTVGLLIAALIGGYLLLSGGGNGRNEITSAKINIKGFENGKLGGDISYWIKEINTETPKVRIESSDGTGIWIYPGDENAYYAYMGGDSWAEIPLSQGEVYMDIAEKAQEWVKKGEGSYDYSYANWSVTITLKDVNPTLPDNLFSPPENADIVHY